MLNSRGGIEADSTVTRLASERFLLITGTAVGNHDLGWLRQHLPEDDWDASVDPRHHVGAEPASGSGVRAPGTILPATTSDDLSNDGVPVPDRARTSASGTVPVLALRVTYVGELGWELYAAHRVRSGALGHDLGGGREHGLVAAGYRAIDALRLEKGYRVWSSDITPDETPYEAGLGFAVALDKGSSSSAARRCVAAKGAGPRKRLRCLVLDDPRSVCLGNEPVRVGGEIVGRVTRAAMGSPSSARSPTPTCRRTPAIGTRGEVDVFGEWIGFEVMREPLWDPAGERMRA